MIEHLNKKITGLLPGFIIKDILYNNCDFSNSDLSGVVFVECTFYECTFNNTNLGTTCFLGCSLDKRIVTGKQIGRAHV